MVSYFIIATVLVVIVILLILFLRKNAKDKKSLENKIKASEIKPEKHSKDDQEE